MMGNLAPRKCAECLLPVKYFEAFSPRPVRGENTKDLCAGGAYTSDAASPVRGNLKGG